MNPSSAPSDLPPQEASSQIRMVKAAGRNLLRLALGWAAMALLCFVASRLSQAQPSLLALGGVGLAGAIGLIYLGRWLQNRRMERWLQSRCDASLDGQPRGLPDIDESFSSFSVRAYSSIGEARSRGWSFGPHAGQFQGDTIPAWAQVDGQRFFFAGLAPAGGMPIVPDDVRLFGRLRYQLSADSASQGAKPPVATA